MDRTFLCRQQTETRIVVGRGVEARLPELIAPLRPDGIVLVHDARLDALAARLSSTLGALASIPVAASPDPKRLAVIGELADRLHAANATRSSVLVALGGGTLTDLAAFLASIYLRGMPCVLCPTTTLSICDAALGGKNGVDHSGLKNRLGTIRQPNAIVADLDWLQSLPDVAFREGLVEVVKKAALLDAAHFETLGELAPALIARDDDATLAAITMAVEMKMAIVVADERESGRRRALNFGHTIGHALESLAEGALPHGLAVACGMIAECRAADVDAAVVARIAALLGALGVATAPPQQLVQPDRLWALAQKDKKSTRGRVPMYVPERIGHGRIVELTPDALRRAFS